MEKHKKNLIKSEQRRAAAKRNMDKIEEIMNSKSDSKIFAKLANRQKKKKTTVMSSQ